MDKYIELFKKWISERQLREKVLVAGLTWAFLYGIFALVLFKPVDDRGNELAKQVKLSIDQANNWKTQLQYLAEIPNSPGYKEWLNEHNSYMTLKNKYKSLLSQTGSAKWDDIIKTILSNYPNITIEKIENMPEAVFEGSKIQSQPDSIYQQQMRLVVLGNFNDIVAYLTTLESEMPNIHWDTLSYTVTEYPIARVQMEFSILYEKSKTHTQNI
jgi:hypothetical protein